MPKCGRNFNRTSPLTWGCAALFALALIGLCPAFNRTPSRPPSPQKSEADARTAHEADDLMTELMAKF